MAATETRSSSGLVTISTSPDIRIFYTITPPLPINLTRPVLVLSASLAANTTLWNETAAYFARTHTVIRYDARFHGQSPPSQTPGFSYAAGHSIEDLARDVVALLDALSIPAGADVSFIGLSIGAGVGVTLAGNVAPGQFRKAVIVGTKAKAGKDDWPVYEARIKLARESSSGVQTQARDSVIRWFGQEWASAHPDEAAAVENMVARQSVDGLEASMVALKHLDIWPHADAVRARGDGGKLLFVVGEDDGAALEDTKKLAERTGSEVVVVPKAGHIVNLQQPEEFHRIVGEWLAKM